MSRKVLANPRKDKGTLADFGEDRVLAALLAELPAGPADGSVIAGAGDDCAIVGPAKAGRWSLLKTDCIIEGVHFAPDTLPRKVGWKALCRPLSDIAAMGGVPSHALITLAISEQVALHWATELYAGIARAAREFGVTVVGGETARSLGGCFISVCVTGTVAAKHCVKRAGAKVGDTLYVTGRLGGSFARGHHLNFRPRLAEGRWLAERFRLHAMMDLSDGLAADLPRLALASGVGFRLDRDRIPRTSGCSTQNALGDGEDYELLFALHPGSSARLEHAWKDAFPNVPLTEIGTVEAVGIESGVEGVSGYHHFTRTKERR